MIKGMTHDENGIINHVAKYRGKISAGYGPKEPPNMENYPVPCGFFRMLREVTETQRIGASQKEVTVKKWIMNQKAQEALEIQNKQSKTPRLIEFICLYHSIEEFWESSLSMFSQSEGLLCKSYGEGTPAKYLTYGPNNSRIWIQRKFNGADGCTYKNCPDFCAGKCKPVGLMKVFPTADLSTMPYRFETRSINTIIGIESCLRELWTLLKAAHSIRQMEAGKQLPFDGFFGAKLYLVHRKIKSGGRDVFITEVFPTPDFNTMVMEPIKRGLEQKRQRAIIAGAEGSVSLLEQASERLIAGPAEEVEAIPLDSEDERAIAENFGRPEEVDGVDVPNEGAEKLLDEGPKK